MTLNPRVLYRGYGANCLNMGGVTCFQFAANGIVKKAVTGGQVRKLTSFEQIYAGFAAGFLSGIVCSPLELVMIQQQVKGGSFVATAGQVLPKAGRGLFNCSMREGIYSAGYLGIGPVVRSYLWDNHRDKFGSEDQARMVGAILAGLFGAYLSHPFDTIKTCMQGDVEQKRFRGMSDTAATLWREGGVQKFYRGVVFRCLRQICAVFILDKARVSLAPLMFPKAFEGAENDQ